MPVQLYRLLLDALVALLSFKVSDLVILEYLRTASM